MKQQRELHCTICGASVSSPISDAVAVIACIVCPRCHKERRENTKRLAAHVYRCQAAAAELHDLAAKVLDEPSLAHGADDDGRPIEIEIVERSFTVRQGDKFADELTFDEMLGLVACLTVPGDRKCVRWMKTQAEHDAWLNRLKNMAERARKDI